MTFYRDVTPINSSDPQEETKKNLQKARWISLPLFYKRKTEAHRSSMEFSPHPILHSV